MSNNLTQEMAELLRNLLPGLEEAWFPPAQIERVRELLAQYDSEVDKP